VATFNRFWRWRWVCSRPIASVTLAAPNTYAGWIQAYGVHPHPVRFNPEEFMRRPEMQALAKSRNVVRQLRMMRDEMGPALVEGLEEYWQAASEAEFVVQTGTGHGGVEAASVRNLPMAFAFLQPFAPTRAIPSFFLPLRFSLGGGYNYLTHALLLRAIWPTLSLPLNQ
jgi:hypothetical protein